MAEYGNLPKDIADKDLEIFREIAVLIGYAKPGDKISVKDTTKYTHEQLLTLPEDKCKA